MACGNGAGSCVWYVASCGHGQFPDILDMNYWLTGSPSSLLSSRAVSTYGCIKPKAPSDLRVTKFPKGKPTPWVGHASCRSHTCVELLIFFNQFIWKTASVEGRIGPVVLLHHVNDDSVTIVRSAEGMSSSFSIILSVNACFSFIICRSAQLLLLLNYQEVCHRDLKPEAFPSIDTIYCGGGW